MPKIPFQPAQSMLPVRTQVGKVSFQDTGIPQLGQGLGVLADQLEKFQQLKDTAEANRQLSNAETALATTWGGIKDKWENGIKNWDESLPDQAKQDLDNLAKVGDSITNPRAKQQFQVTFAKLQAAAQIELNGHQNRLQIGQGIADSTTREDALRQLRAKVTTPAEKGAIDQLFEVQLGRDKESGFFKSPEELANRKIAWDQFKRNDDVVSYLDNMTKKNGPEATLKHLMDTDVHRDLVNRSDEATVNGYESQLRQVYGLQKAEQAQAKEDYQNKVENNVFHLMATGQVTSANIGELNKQIDQLPMDGGKIELSNKVSQFIEKSDSFINTRNPMLFTDVMTRALHRDSTLTEQEVRGHIGKEDGYSAADGLKIIEKMNSPEDKYKDKILQYADSYLKQAIFPPGLVMDPESGDYTERAKLLYHAQTMVEQKIKEGLANGKSLDDLLMPKFDKDGKVINKDSFILDNIVSMFAPGSQGLQKGNGTDINGNPEPPKGFKIIK
jgi:hypothetical protein